MKTGSAKKRSSGVMKRSSTGENDRSIKKRPEETEDPNSAATSPSYNLRLRDATKPKKYSDPEWDVEETVVEGEVEIPADAPDERKAPTPPPRRPRPRTRVTAATREEQALLPTQLKESLKRLKNLLKLPKARRWAYCEYFIADLDRVLLQPDEEFRHCLRESFPDLSTHELHKAEWRQIRRLIGKPRRYSQAFLDYEREDLERKRKRIREIQKGAALTLDDEGDTPMKIPHPLAVGDRVFARIRFPKDGIFSGIVDAVMDDRYRIIFDKDVVMPLVVPDCDLMRETTQDLVPVSFFLENNKAQQPANFRGNFLLTCEKLLASDEMASLMEECGVRPGGTSTGTDAGREERCGNYPLRMVVMLVKSAKLVERKKAILSTLRELNCEAERFQMRDINFAGEFQEKYADNVIELEEINKQLVSYLSGVGEYMGTLLPHMTEVAVTSRPDVLQKFCNMHASQIVKHTNVTMTNVDNRNTLDIITSLTAIMLEIRALGQQSCNAYELNSLKESIDGIKKRLDSENGSIFEDYVEVTIKHIEMLMRGWKGPEETPVEPEAPSAE